MALLPMFLACVVLAGYFSQRSLRAAEEALLRQGENLARQLAMTASIEMPAGQLLYMKRLIDHEGAIHGTLSIGVADARGAWWLANNQASVLRDDRPGMQARVWWSGDRVYFRQPIVVQDPQAGNPALGAAPVIGQVTLAFPTAEIDNARAEIVVVTTLVVALLLLVAGTLAWRLSSGLSKPLDDTIDAVKALAGGALGTRLRGGSRGEIGELERGVNAMAETLEAHTRDLEARIADATANLLDQKKAADAATQAKSRFLAAASHDLRQPLHTLTLLVGALRERLADGDAEASRLAAHIEAATQAMGGLLNTLLDLSRLEAGSIVANPRCCHLDGVFQSLERQFAPLAADKGLRLRLRRPRTSVFSDPGLLERVLANLIANAIRYTDRGGVLVGARQAGPDWLRIEVVDSGVGIPEEFQGRIFEEYFRVEHPGRGQGKGLGLGLAIVARLTRLLGNEVTVASRPGKGSRFGVRVQRCALPAGQRDLARETSASLPGNALVAIVDDDHAVLEALLALFESWGIDAATGDDAAAMIDELRRARKTPDIVLSDYHLADGRTGDQAIAAFRLAFGTRLPAVLITADDKVTSGDASVPVLRKPIKPARLRALLSHMLRRRAPEQ
jgi:signal transduction histidine kinase